jgi:catechol 2,3-dioxygenase-like lactoylglutathione lyase family enzyme
MADTQADTGSPVGPEANQAGMALMGADLAGASIAGAEVAGAEAANAEVVADAEMAGAQVTGAEAENAEVAGAEVAGAEAANAEVAGAEAVRAAGYAPASYQSSSWPFTSDLPPTGAIHHVELWVPNLDKAITSWGWLLTALGFRMFQDWPGGRSWQAGHSYIVVEQSPARTASRHDRCRPGLNHLAFHVETRKLVDELTREAQLHGWKLMFADQHPFAGGPQHYAAYLENSDGYEVELVAH